MKVMTLFGTRPEIIRLSQVIKQLDRFCEQVVVHTGQNFEPNLSDVFFEDLELRPPDLLFGIRSTSFSRQVGEILQRVDGVLKSEKPDRLLILGDTNSGLAAIVAARMAIPVYHLEAGNRCYDDRVPEEINRRIIDHSSTILMPYTHRSMQNLLQEGFERDRIFVVGNPIYEVLRAHKKSIQESNAGDRLELKPGKYFLATVHRAENVDVPARLEALLKGFARVSSRFELPLVVSLHPRTAARIAERNLSPSTDKVRMTEPLSFSDFVALEQSARVVITDSGTVQEECSILKIPSVTIRDVTERAETIEAGGSILCGADPDDLIRATEIAIGLDDSWSAPPEYLVKNVSQTVTKIVLGYLGPVGMVRHKRKGCVD